MSLHPGADVWQVSDFKQRCALHTEHFCLLVPLTTQKSHTAELDISEKSNTNQQYFKTKPEGRPDMSNMLSEKSLVPSYILYFLWNLFPIPCLQADLTTYLPLCCRKWSNRRKKVLGNSNFLSKTDASSVHHTQHMRKMLRDLFPTRGQNDHEEGYCCLSQKTQKSYGLPMLHWAPQ